MCVTFIFDTHYELGIRGTGRLLPYGSTGSGGCKSKIQKIKLDNKQNTLYIKHMSDKNKSYCTNESFWNELDPQLKKVYKLLSKQANKQSNNKKENKKSSSNKKSPLTKQAIAQLIQQGQYAQDYHNAVIYSFSIETKQLTKAERKIAKICFKISHSKYMAQLYQMVLINEKAHASLKVIAEIKGLINSGSSSNNDQSNTQPTNLSINLSQEPTKKPPEEETNNNKDKDNLSNSPPLDLMLN